MILQQEWTAFHIKLVVQFDRSLSQCKHTNAKYIAAYALHSIARHLDPPKFVDLGWPAATLSSLESTITGVVCYDNNLDAMHLQYCFSETHRKH